MVNDGVEIKAAGAGKSDPLALLSSGYTPKYKLQLFDTFYYLTNLRYDDNLKFLVAYVLLPDQRTLYPRIFYKDLSLVWRSATHYARSEDENWIGKGDLKWVYTNGEEAQYSAEETTNLPLEIQSGLDTVSRRIRRAKPDHEAVPLVLRRAPDHRIEPYQDFSGPRKRAQSNPRNLINRDEYVAYFTRENDPTSLRFESGFEPDFRRGVVELSASRSHMYRGRIRKFRILSKNQRIQYQFIAAPKHAWIIPPQTLTTEIMSYGVRTIDVHADEHLFVPGYEYHYVDETEDPPQLHSQIPAGFAGRAHQDDPARVDASPWLEKLPVIRQFRRMVLGKK